LAIGAALLFFLLIGMTVGPRLRVLTGISPTFMSVRYSAAVRSEAPASERPKAKPRLQTKGRTATPLAFMSAAAMDIPEFEREEALERTTEGEAPLPSTPHLELPSFVDPDQLLHVPPGAITLTRPQSLTPLYVTFAALQAVDAITTLRALQKPGLREANPLVRPFARNVPAMVILKGASTTVTVMAVEKLWRRNRVAAVATMVGINAAYGIIVSHNAALR
jgi:hypothetical protein